MLSLENSPSKFNGHARKKTPEKRLGSPQEAIVHIRNRKNERHAAIKIDSLEASNSQLKIIGWCFGECTIKLVHNKRNTPHEISRNRRLDVANSLKVSEPEGGFGFTVTTTLQNGEYTLQLQTLMDEHETTYDFPLNIKKTITHQEKKSNSPQPLGFIEVAAVANTTTDAVVVGWALHSEDTAIWIEDEEGFPFSLQWAFRLFRQDVLDAYGNSFGHTSSMAGFMLHINGVKPGNKLRLMAQMMDGEPAVLGEVECTSLPTDPVAASRWLFGIQTPMGQLHQRFPLVDIPVINSLKEHQQHTQDDLPVQVRQLGQPPRQPLVSIIIPLYGRTDFVEHQLIEFTRDSWLAQHAEIIYVIDDPRLVEEFAAQAELLYRLYRLPFRWVWGSTNRGFSGANNLGVQHASSEYLLFLNSDAFPQQPGWLQQMLDVLADNPEIGAVGPRLVFADGSIQHCSMEFSRREELGIWINHHPRMGLDPKLDPHRELTTVSAVTGACLAVSRINFDRIGGWDTSYLIGDFEDSDFCLKLRRAGLQIAYLPTVQLTHLERQSFKLLGQDDFRTRVVIYNAVRHQTRWRDLIEASTNGIV
ncbi:glycosyltransferase family 2 protein [Azotobacter chroococcum]|uniref:Glycosyl transferase family 2 WgeB n=1 Tax=Azotobacter chroococcum NCIMB 8003 TaxID=1328314 RepID=A0A0C4WRA1_9GAMM|nr:glycosyltransferase family 2 protein [Azotobacter chroococcum]AJE22085.1 Glycosyl transferase family 2 WgeB [Azotobacter chroococcum NCIMB 8003]